MGLACAPSGHATDAEWDRLDGQHNGIANLNQNLAPVDLGQPKKILEIGSAWAIQAAKLYPDADVLAVDMNPLPARPLPSNIRFQQLNVLEPVPFLPGSFDVVHIRFVLCHLPHGHTVLPRIIELVAPSGWLLVDDIAARGRVGSDDSHTTKQQLKAARVQHVAEHKVTYKHLGGGVEFCEQIPETASGKMLRRLLRDHKSTE
ncbi:S-adenosyl-L-methionine-dependent methyltransferase [Hymenopellis radicata]|nr:S-adenosyl-L-methionine-dependent methyltransferase [Hymenopellis radicata]